jgi:hypothetical protein
LGRFGWAAPSYPPLQGADIFINGDGIIHLVRFEHGHVDRCARHSGRGTIFPHGQRAGQYCCADLNSSADFLRDEHQRWDVVVKEIGLLPE